MMKVNLRPRHHHHNTKQGSSIIIAGGHNNMHHQVPVPSSAHNPAVTDRLERVTQHDSSKEDTTTIDSLVKQPSKCPFH